MSNTPSPGIKAILTKMKSYHHAGSSIPLHDSLPDVRKRVGKSEIALKTSICREGSWARCVRCWKGRGGSGPVESPSARQASGYKRHSVPRGDVDQTVCR